MASLVVATLFEKSASDSGFDLPLGRVGDWHCFASSHSPLKIWLIIHEPNQFAVSFSDAELAKNLFSFGSQIQLSLPPQAFEALLVGSTISLYRLLKRAFQLSRALPSQPLNEFQKRTLTLPRNTEVERLTIQRIGQDLFRERLFEFWDGKCAVTGMSISALLRASHIKSWKDCSTDAERLDVYNGLLLAPHLDAAFDRGFITFDNSGSLIVSVKMNSEDFRKLGFDLSLKCGTLETEHFKYLSWHREEVFQKG